MNIVRLTKADKGSILSLFKAVTRELQKREIKQWDRFYPNRFVIGKDLKQQHLFGMKENNKVIAVITLDRNQSGKYQTISWKVEAEKVGCIHRFAVHPDHQGKGVGKQLLQFAEEQAQREGLQSIRLDVFSANPSAISMYEKAGYQKRGQIFFPFRKKINLRKEEGVMVVLYILAAIVLCLIIGILYQWLATKYDETHYPAPGSFVEIDGRRLHYQSFGMEKGPVIIFDHGCGIGSSSMIWKLVADQVSQFAKVVTYDRAGYGWSDPGPYPRTNESAVEDLRRLIEKVAVNGPIVLVGHSYGGINVRLFAKKYPNLAAGLVLVDATHEDELTSRFPEKYVKGQMMGRKAFKLLKYMCYVGLLRIMGRFNAFAQLQDIVKKFPKKQQPIYQSTFFLNKTAKAVASEFSHLDLGYRSVRGASLGNIPVVVIKSGIVENLNGFSEVEVVETKKALHDVAVEMSKLSMNGELWVAETSGHNIHVEDPELVVKVIKHVCDYQVSAPTGACPPVR